MRRVNPSGYVSGYIAGVFALGTMLLRAADTSPVSGSLAQHRNLGKAFYENPTTQAKAVVEFKKALDLAPNSVRARLSYSLALIRAGKTPEGVAQLKEVQRRDPKLPQTWFNLRIYYKKAGDADADESQFEHMIQLVLGEAIAHSTSSRAPNSVWPRLTRWSWISARPRPEVVP